VKSRAITPEQKRAVVERLLAAWLKVPSQRLGQMLSNVELLYLSSTSSSTIEDEPYLEVIEWFAEEYHE
jgi:hypothetical protein